MENTLTDVLIMIRKSTGILVEVFSKKLDVMGAKIDIIEVELYVVIALLVVIAGMVKRLGDRKLKK